MKPAIQPEGLRRLVRRSRLIQAVAPGLALALAAGYLAFVMDFATAESLQLAACLAFLGWLGSLVFAPGLRRRLATLRSLSPCDEAEPGSEVLDGNAESAFVELVGLPLVMQQQCIAATLLAAAGAPIALWALGFDALLAWTRAWSCSIALIAAAGFVSLLVFYAIKRAGAQARADLAGCIPAAETRSRRIPAHSLAWKLQLAVAFPALAAVLLMANASSERARTASERDAAEWAQRAAAELISADRGLPVSERIVGRLPPKRFWPYPLSAEEMSPDTVARAGASPASRALLAALDVRLAAGEKQGLLLPSAGDRLGAFATLDDAAVLVTSVRRVDLQAVSAERSDALAGLGVLVVVLALVIGRAVARDVLTAIDALTQGAERMAAGDLRPAAIYDAEDEFGELGCALSATKDALRATVQRVFIAADRVDQTAAGILETVAGVVAASADQVRKIRQSHDLMSAIASQVGGVSESARDLNSTIDESSSSVFELGAAGDELNETASVLTAKVDQVSNSLEHMVRSVRHIGVTTDRLAAASEETSSSMEEMASAMRAVDSSAETTANLSSAVVEKAELGQAKVVQTIAGMEAIREATEIAERVIRGLGARTGEIGGILDVIDDVADETNLLALNAAIIAAQAGDQGKAFSVVADEIKELADRVLASTKEIGGLIRAVQEESENAIGAIEAGSASVMSGVDLSAEAGRTLEEITEASRESGTRIGEIVSSVREQTKAASHVVTLMERVREAAELIGDAGAEQDRGNEVVSRSAQTMREVAQQVHRTTEEQARGFGRIRENVEGVRGAVEQITGSLGEQLDACEKLSAFLEQVSEGTRSNEEAAQQVREATRELSAQAQTLREDVERFRV